MNAPLPAPTDYKWELYNLIEDYSQANDLAATMPDKLKEMQVLFNQEADPHVIVGDISGAALVNLGKSWRAIRTKAGLADVRLHDLRHAFASVAASSGMGLPIIGKCLSAS